MRLPDCPVAETAFESAAFGSESRHSPPRWRQQAGEAARWVGGGGPAILVALWVRLGVCKCPEGREEGHQWSPQPLAHCCAAGSCHASGADLLR